LKPLNNEHKNYGLLKCDMWLAILGGGKIEKKT